MVVPIAYHFIKIQILDVNLSAPFIFKIWHSLFIFKVVANLHDVWENVIKLFYKNKM